MAVIDWTNPCARAAALSQSYWALVQGGTIQSIRIKSGGGEREARYAKSDLATLRTEMQRAEDECRAQTGQVPIRRRYAITAGSRKV